MTYFINTNRLKLVEFSGYIQLKSDFRHYLLQISQEAGTDIKNEVSLNEVFVKI